MKQITLISLYCLSFLLSWMATYPANEEAMPPPPCAIACDPVDSSALVDFFNLTNGGSCFPGSPGPGWTNPWDLDDCVVNWQGVTLNANGRVTDLQLNNNGLTGPIPLELSLLTELSLLQMSNNCLTGTIPPEFGDLTNMTRLWIDGNDLVGDLPEELCNMTQLFIFFLDENTFTGTVPPCFNDIDFLFTLDLFDNCFDSLPDLTGMASLAAGEMQVQNNKLTFDDLLPNIVEIGNSYSPQDSVCIELDTTVTTGSEFRLSLGIDAGITTNSYQWYKDGVIFGTPTNSNTLVFNPVNFDIAGVYHCQVTNPALPLLTLHSRSKTVNVICGTSTFEFVEDVCDGFEIEIGGVTYNEANPCSSNTLTGADQYGCDSIVNICLTYSSPPLTVLDTTLCPGESITINGTVYDVDNSSGVESFGVPDQFNCDSSLQINVSFYPPAVFDFDTIICRDDMIVVAGEEFDFDNDEGQVIIDGGSFHDCDSIINVSLSFFDLATSTITDTYCTGQEVVINGTTYDADDPDGTEIITNASWRGCDSIITVDLTFGDGVEFMLETSICRGQEILVNGVTYNCDNPTGTEVIAGGSYLNCDSTILVDLTCIEPVHGMLNVRICEGEEYDFNGTTYDEDNDEGEENLGPIGFNGCDSIVDFTLSFYPLSFSVIDTTVCEDEGILIDGEIETSSGNYIIDGGSFYGCDSTIFVTIVELPSVTITINDVLCPGNSIMVNGTLYNEDNLTGEETLDGGAANGCDSIIIIDISYGDAVISQTDEVLCPGETFTLGTIVLDENNTMYTDTIIGGSQSGCDSITIINISYHPIATSQINPIICSGSFLDIGGEIIDVTNPIDTIVLTDASYTGCDSTVFVNAEIITVPTGVFTTTLCPGESIVINGTTYDEITNSGMEMIPLGSFNNCDTSFTVMIDFHPEATSTINNTLCDGESLDIGGVTLDANNPNDTIILPNASYTGCDSMVFVNLDFHPASTFTIDYTLCFGQEIEVNGTTYDQNMPTGEEVFVGDSFHGCDSTVTIDLSFNSSVQVTIDPVFCDPSSEVIVNDNTYNISMPTGTETMLSVSGCDSIVTIDLTFPDSAFVYYNNLLCSGEEILVNGVVYNEAMPMGTEVQAGASLFGCDVYHVVDLSFNDLSESSTNETICAGADILIGGVLFNADNTSDTITLVDAAYTGCDSLIIVNIDFYPEIITTIDSTLCEGQIVVVNGTTYDVNLPMGQEIMNSSNGCDSTVNITLTFGGAVLSNYNDVLCEGEEITINGTIYDIDNPMGSDTFPDGSFTGCDSILNILISFIPPSYNNIDTTLCFGEQLLINNIVYDQNNLGGMDTLFNANEMGCDSILNITVSYFPLSESSIDTMLCSGESFIWNGINYSSVDTIINDVIVGGSYTGCDSLLTINVSHYAPITSNFNTMLCIGEELDFHGTIFNADNMEGDVVLQDAGFQGCDSTISVNISYYLLAASSATNSICEGDTFFWNGQALTTPGNYEASFSGLSSNGCDSMAMLELNVVNFADLGFANAGEDVISCEETLQITGNQPANVTGTWAVLSGSADLDDPSQAQTTLFNMGTDTSLVLSWSLSSDLCPNYNSDTILIMAGIVPDAADDDYTAEPGMLEVPIRILDNDFYENIDDWYFNILDIPAGDIEDQGDGLFNYIASSDLLGGIITFQYELCNEDCPEVCDTAMVRIQLQEEIFLDFPNTITANGDGINDFFVVPDIASSPDQFNKQELLVFNRWGDLVYSAKPYQNDWGGTNQNGKTLPQGTYYYVLRLDVAEGLIYSGDITILK